MKNDRPLPPETADAQTAAPARLLIVGNCSQSNAIFHRVFDPAGISPTVMENHGYPVLILEPQATLTPLTSPTPTPTVFVSAAGFSPSTPTPMNEDARLQVAATIDSGLTFAGTTRQDDKAYHPDGIAPAVTCCDGKPHTVIQPLTAALRGRPEASGGNAQHFELGGPVANALIHVQKDSLVAIPAEPSMLTARRTEQGRELRRQGVDVFAHKELVPRDDGVANTLTSVQKDNYLLEPQQPPMPAGTVIANTQLNCYRGTVDDPAPCVCAAAGMGGGHVPMVTETADPAEPQMLTPLNYGGNHRHVPSDTAATLSASSGGPRQSQYVIEPQPAPADGVCPGSGLQPGEPSGCYDNQSGDFMRDPTPGIARTVKADHHNAVLIDGVFYRVRKLTPRETGRLMGLSDEEYDIMASAKIPSPTKSDPTATRPISKTALYKLHGNSIVVDVLYHIFRTMFLPGQPENATTNQPTQLTLFP